MGFFSSIGKVFSSVAKPVLGVVGGVLGMNAQNDAAAQAQSNYNQQMGFAREQFEYQKALHQNQLQWRVEDAKKAGLHPMAALGLSSMQFSPVSGASYSGSSPTDYSWIGDLGQNLDYAATKGKTNAQQEQAFALSQKSAEIALEGQELDNEFKRLQIMEQVSRLTQTGPAAPTANSRTPLNVSEDPFLDEPINSNAFRLDEKGRKVDIIPSEALKSRTEDVFGVEWMPFIDSAKLNYKTKVLGEPFAGHWWHSDKGEYLPYPPKRRTDAKHDNQSSYYSNSPRYR